METSVVCPSGLEGVIRSIKVKDEPVFEDQRLIKSGRVITEMCKLCWVKTTKPGPYKAAAGDTPDWRRLLQADIFAIFVAIRRASYGDEYPVQIGCQKCGDTIHEELDLGALEIEPLGSDAIEHLESGTPMSVMHEGKRVEYRLLYDYDTSRQAEIQSVHSLPARHATLTQRLMSIEGVRKGVMGLAEHVKEMNSDDANYLLEVVEEADGGVDTEFVTVCRGCGKEARFDFPLQISFFKKKESKKRQTRKRKKVVLLSDIQPDTENEYNGSDDTPTTSTHPPG